MFNMQASFQMVKASIANRAAPRAPRVLSAYCSSSRGGLFKSGGRFTGATDPVMDQFNASIGYDKRMWKQDITGSVAYARALGRTGIISVDEVTQICEGLQLVKTEWAEGRFEIHGSDEDIHTANERRLTELIGSVAGKLHTGRSRNDQVATDMRLYLSDQIGDLRNQMYALIETAATRAEGEVDLLMPGYTHLQKAQPVRWSHWVMSHASAWQRDMQRLDDLNKRVMVMPLGSGALAGNAFGIDRVLLAQELGFDHVSPNSMDAVSDRDFVAEFLFWSSLTMVHMSRWAEDLIIYSSGEFKYVTMADAYSTGSSLMPQKKNPDALELLRGKSGRVCGGLSGFLTVMKGTPTTYNKDMQEDKEMLFDAMDTLAAAIPIATGVLSTLSVHPDKMAGALQPEMLATDLAEYLVRKGVPFRETHHTAGEAVRLAEERGIPLSQLSLQDLQSLQSAFEEDVANLWNFENSVESRNVIGGTSKQAVLDSVHKMRDWLAANKNPQRTSSL